MTAVRGNVDKGAGAARYPETATLQIAGRSIYLIHDIQDLQIDLAARGFDAVVFGHSHRPKIETVDGVLHLNPGSSGGRRFRLPVTLATLDVSGCSLKPVIHDLTSG